MEGILWFLRKIYDSRNEESSQEFFHEGKSQKKKKEKTKKKKRETTLRKNRMFDYLGESHGREPTGARLFTVESDDLESGFSRLDGFELAGAGRPQADAPREGCSVSLPGVCDLIHRVIRQVGEQKRLLPFLKLFRISSNDLLPDS